MGRPDDRYVKNNDYGRRFYVRDENYAEQMGIGSRKPAFVQNSELYKQSEFKKPYSGDSYEAMEYTADVPTGTSPPGDAPFDNPQGPIQPPDSNPWSVKFLCFSSPCYGYGEMHCEPISCNWVIQGYEIRSCPAGCDYILGLSQICGECPEGETFQILFDVLLRAQFQHNGATITVDGRYYGISMSHCIGACDDTGIAWDHDASASTVAREASVSVSISDSNGTKGGPYTWSVSGTGFTLDESETEGGVLSNTLNADATACGTAIITVEGCGGTTVEGGVRCTEGSEWTSVTEGCKITGTPSAKDEYFGAIRMSLVRDQYSQEQTVQIRAVGNPICAEANCASTNCGYGTCLDAVGCTDCLDWTCEDKSGYFSCPQSWCCTTTGNTCANYGRCMCNKTLRWKEWVCS